MTTKAKKRVKPRLFARVRKLVDPDTGEIIAAFVPTHPIDRRIARERKCTNGSEWRLEITRPRNPKFFRLAHALGRLAGQQLERFCGKDGHAVIKELQRESGVCCELLEIDLGPLGKAQVNQARSLSFDEMEEPEFAEFWKGITRHLITKDWPCMTPEQIEYQAELIGDGE